MSEGVHRADLGLSKQGSHQYSITVSKWSPHQVSGIVNDSLSYTGACASAHVRRFHIVVAVVVYEVQGRWGGLCMRTSFEMQTVLCHST